MQHGEAELRITEEMPPVTISLHSPVSGPGGAIFTSHITHSQPIVSQRRMEEMLLRGLT